jgi:hypothetical protein
VFLKKGKLTEGETLSTKFLVISKIHHWEELFPDSKMIWKVTPVWCEQRSYWNSQGARSRHGSKRNRNRTVEEEAVEVWKTRSEVRRIVVDRIRWMCFTDARGCVVDWGNILQAGGRGFNPSEVMRFVINWPNPSSRTMAMESTKPLTEMSTRNLVGGKGWPALKADNLTAICEPIVKKNVGTSTSHNPMGLHGLIQKWLYFFIASIYLYKITFTRFIQITLAIDTASANSLMTKRPLCDMALISTIIPCISFL